MGGKDLTKPRRHKKRKSRTEVSSDSESEYEKEPEPVVSKPSPQPQPEPSKPVIEPKSKPPAEAETSAAFTSFYMQRATTEFAEDLDRVRGAGDFKGEALGILVDALKQGTTVFSPADQRRIVNAGQAGAKDSADE